MTSNHRTGDEKKVTGAKPSHPRPAKIHPDGSTAADGADHSPAQDDYGLNVFRGLVRARMAIGLAFQPDVFESHDRTVAVVLKREQSP